MKAESTSIQIGDRKYTFVESEKKTGSELAYALGYTQRTITAMKAAGCPFFGRFSSVSVVRTWEYYNPTWRRDYEATLKKEQ